MNERPRIGEKRKCEEGSESAMDTKMSDLSAPLQEEPLPSMDTTNGLLWKEIVCGTGEEERNDADLSTQRNTLSVPILNKYRLLKLEGCPPRQIGKERMSLTEKLSTITMDIVAIPAPELYWFMDMDGRRAAMERDEESEESEEDQRKRESEESEDEMDGYRWRHLNAKEEGEMESRYQTTVLPTDVEHVYEVTCSITDMIANDIGLHLLKVVNKYGRLLTKVRWLMKGMKVPQWVEEPQIRRINEQTELQLTCAIRTFCPFTVKWYRNNRSVHNDFRIQIKADDVTSEFSDQVVTDREPLTERAAEKAPRGVARSQKIVFEFEPSIELQMIIYTDEDLTNVRWVNPLDDDIEESEKFRITTLKLPEVVGQPKRYTLTLIIKGQESADGGNYTCVVSNPYGECSGVFNIRLNGSSIDHRLLIGVRPMRQSLNKRKL